MTDPTPPDDLPADLLATLPELSADQLRALAEYAERLADASVTPTDGEAGGGSGGTAAAGGDGVDDAGSETAPSAADRPDTPPEGVPGKATLTVKEINDNRYYYWQWREGDDIRSQYVGPVGGGE